MVIICIIGKTKKIIPLHDDNLGGYLKVYGFNTGNEAYQESKKIKRYMNKHSIEWQTIDITESKVEFENYQHYRSVCKSKG